MASAAPVGTASATTVKAAAEAGTSARRKTPLLSARTETAESAGANAALATRLGIASGSPAVAAERLRRPFGTVVNAARAFTFPAGKLWRPLGTVVITLCAFAVPAGGLRRFFLTTLTSAVPAGRLSRSVVVNTAIAFASIESVAVIKGPT